MSGDIQQDKKKEEKLSLKQELFCGLYASSREFFGSGVDSYIEAYNVDVSKKGAYHSAASAASRLLTNVKILERIDKHLDSLVLNDQHVDKQLGFWITQKASPQASVAAIKEYNALKQRITKKLDLTSGGEKLTVSLVEFVDGSSQDQSPDTE